jgi:hypothetical protein
MNPPRPIRPGNLMRWSESSKVSNSSSEGSIDSPGRSPRDHFVQVMNQGDQKHATADWTFTRELHDGLLDPQSQDTHFVKIPDGQQRYTPSPVKNIDTQQLHDLIILSLHTTPPLKTRISISQALETCQAEIDAPGTLIPQHFSEGRTNHRKATLPDLVSIPRVYRPQIQHKHEPQENDEQLSLPCSGFTEQESNTIAQPFPCPVMETHPSSVSIEDCNSQIHSNYTLAAFANNELSESLYEGMALANGRLGSRQTASVGAQFDCYTFDMPRNDDILGHYAI